MRFPVGLGRFSSLTSGYFHAKIDLRAPQTNRGPSPEYKKETVDMAEVTMKQWLDTIPDELIDELEYLEPQDLLLMKGLNPSQLKAVLETEGTVQICSVAGSGKTTVLTRRIAYMLRKGIPARNILCTTFTKKATQEMTERMSRLIPKLALQQISIGTMHSIGYRILNREYKEINHHLAPAFKKELLMNFKLKKFWEEIKKSIIMDRRVQQQVKEEVSDIAIPQLTKAFGLAKNAGIGHREYEQMHTGKGPRMEAYIELYNRYEERKWQEQLIDADDLLFNLWKLFNEHPDIMAKYQRHFKYILVDEAQDNNSLNWTLVKMLALPQNNLFIVGDDDQSMYGFRGAVPGEFIHLKNNFPSAKLISLEDNYRSNPAILNVANKLISNNTERISKKLKAHKQDDSHCVMYSHYQDENEEASGVVQEILDIQDHSRHQLQRVACLYRTNAQSRALEDQLIMAGLPYVIHGGISFYERKEVKDIVSYLQLVLDPNDDVAFERVINVPSRYLGKKFLEKVKGFNGSHWHAILGGIKMVDYEKRGTTGFRDLVQNMRKLYKDGATPIDLVDFLLIDGGYEAYLKEDGEEEEEGNSRLENISTLKYVLGRYDKIEEFLSYITKMTSEAKHSIDGVQLMSVHKSKGLEFGAVFVVGMSEGVLPHFKSIEAVDENPDSLAIEEERRLGYVGVTRAESELYISSVSSFNGRPSGKSRFIHEMGLKTTQELIAEASLANNESMEVEVL